MFFVVIDLMFYNRYFKVYIYVHTHNHLVSPVFKL